MILTKTLSIYVLGAVAGAAAALTPELLTAIGAIAVAVITAAGAVIVNVLVAKRVNKNVDSVKAVGQESLAEIKVVQGHVNSAAAASAAEIAGLRKEIVLMQNVAADKDKTAALLAQSAATVPANTAKTSLT